MLNLFGFARHCNAWQVKHSSSSVWHNFLFINHITVTSLSHRLSFHMTNVLAAVNMSHFFKTS